MQMPRIDSTLVWARIGKGVALVGFLLPWVTVSCSGSPLATMSGMDMAVGRMQLTNPMTGVVQARNVDPSWWVIAALAVAVAALIVSFLLRPKAAGAVLAAGALTAGALGAGALQGTTQAAHKELAEQRSDNEFGAIAASAITVQRRYGFWVSMAGFLAALGLGGAVWRGYEHIRVPVQLRRPDAAPPA